MHHWLYMITVYIIATSSADGASPKIKPFQFSKELNIGKRASVICTVIDGDPPFAFSWYKDESEIHENNVISVKTVDEFNSLLAIKKLSTNSNGNYTCKVSNQIGTDIFSSTLYLKGSQKPEITPFQFSGSLRTGHRTSVMCAVMTGTPPFAFKWLKDGHDLKESNSITIRNIDEYNSNLAILKLGPEHNGNYTCRVSNQAGYDVQSNALLMKGFNAPKIQQFSFTKDLDLGMRVSVQCAVLSGDPPFEFMWLKDGVRLSERSGISLRKIDDFTYNLVILKVEADSNGNYSCRVSNAAGVDETFDVLTIKGVRKPEIRPFHFTGELKSGKRVTLACSVIDGDPPFQFQWFKDGTKVEAKGNIQTKTYEEDHFSNIVIAKLNPDSNGNYTCRVSNTAGHDEHSANLLIKGMKLPEIKPFHFSGELKSGKRVTLTCSVVDGDPPFTFHWMKDGSDVKQNQRIIVRTQDDIYVSNLIITKLAPDDNGNYTCRVSNSAGSDAHSEKLLMKDKIAPKINPFHFSGEINLGMRASVSCAIIDGDPPFEFFWFKNGIPLSDEPNTAIRKFDEFTLNLAIQKVGVNSNGNYSCKVTNKYGHDEKSAVLSVKGVKKPKIKAFHFSSDLETGMRAAVMCAVIGGEPPFEFSWFKDGVKLLEHRDISVKSIDEFTSNLIIKNLGPTSNGKYTCKVSNSGGEDEYSDELSMKDQTAPKINPFHFSGEINLGMRASVSCAIIDGDPPFEISWFKNGILLSDGSNISIRKVDDFTLNLALQKIGVNSNGNYSCRVTNKYGHDEKSALLSVKGQKVPEIKPFHFSGELKAGRRTSLSCSVIDGEPPFVFRWLKDNVEIRQNNNIVIRTQEDIFVSNLVILKLGSSDNGNYTCRVSNAAGSAEHSEALLMRRSIKPDVKPFHFAGELRFGKRTVVTCAVIDGEPPFSFTWLKDGMELKTSQDFSIASVDGYISTLTIPKLDAESNGNYTCRVRNNVGTDEKNDVLRIKGLKSPEIAPIRVNGNIVLGERIGIICFVSRGDPPFSFMWLKDGSIIKNLPNLGIASHTIDEYTSALTISKLGAESNGNYSCKVRNDAGSDEKFDVVLVKAQKRPKIKPFQFSGELTLSQRTSLTCSVIDGDPPFAFSWFKDTLPIKTNSNIVIRTQEDVFISLLIITKLGPGDNGNYTCQASNGVGSSQHTSQLLMRSVKKPKIKAFHFSADLETGMRAAVMCAVIAGDPPFEVSWFKDGVKLLEPRDISIKSIDEFTSHLTIKNLGPESNALNSPGIGPFRFSGNMMVGNRVGVMCVVSRGDPPFTFTWLKDGVEIRNIPNLSIAGVDEYTSTLSISKLEAESNGNYTCRVSNKAGIDEKYDSVMVKALKAPKIKDFHFSGQLSAGMRTVVLCAVIDGDPPFTFSWFKDAKQLQESKDVTLKALDEFTSTLIVTNLGPDHNGNYTCKVTNPAGIDQHSDILSMRVYKFVLANPELVDEIQGGGTKPDIRQFHFSGDLKIGKRTAVACAVIDGDPPFSFVWLKDGQQLNNNQEISIANVDDYLSTLTIAKLGPHSNGNYTCQVSNIVGLDEKHDVLLMKATKPDVKQFQFSGELRFGRRTVVTCAVLDGDPPFVFQWIKDGLELKNSREYSIASVDGYISTLTIFKLGAESNGNYTCKVSNLAGTDEKKRYTSNKRQ
ncbi:titin-like [Uloborus diversus]|uniref:titin-like n=1 Tax=Uloborus diversus TaxID=327109 RepID=UPI002409D013|nr:titin-like [Uloborus diversus]